MNARAKPAAGGVLLSRGPAGGHRWREGLPAAQSLDGHPEPHRCRTHRRSTRPSTAAAGCLDPGASPPGHCQAQTVSSVLGKAAATGSRRSVPTGEAQGHLSRAGCPRGREMCRPTPQAAGLTKGVTAVTRAPGPTAGHTGAGYSRWWPGSGLGSGGAQQPWPSFSLDLAPVEGACGFRVRAEQSRTGGWEGEGPRLLPGLPGGQGSNLGRRQQDWL